MFSMFGLTGAPRIEAPTGQRMLDSSATFLIYGASVKCCDIEKFSGLDWGGSVRRIAKPELDNVTYVFISWTKNL